jgi:ankyrin repeat protein
VRLARCSSNLVRPTCHSIACLQAHRLPLPFLPALIAYSHHLSFLSPATCLGVLLHLDDNITKDSLEKFPLAEYAAEHWVGHAQFENVSSRVQDGMKRLFDPSKNHLSVWVWIIDPEYPWYRPERPERPSKATATPLHYAALCGIHDVAEFLVVEHSQDVNAQGFDNKETPLDVASRSGHADVAQLLLEHGADAEAHDDYHESTPLLLASQWGHVEVARVLLERGTDMEVRDGNNWTPLMVASFFGHVEIARVLLEYGADVKATGMLNQTPLYHAQREQVARLLLKHGADPNALDIRGHTPLHEASEAGHVGVAQVLLDHGVDVDARDAHNATPLHHASCPMIQHAHPDVARLLLQNGSDIHARDNRGRTPFMRAIEDGDDSIIQLLLEYGAEDHRF